MMAMARAGGGEETPGHLPGVFLKTAGERPDEVAAKYVVDGKWTAMTWGELEKSSRRLGAGLIALGLQPGDRVNVMGSTRIEWIVDELAAQLAGATSVPIYHTLLPDDVAHVITDSRSKYAFVENAEQLETLRSVRDKIPGLEKIVLMEGEGDGDWVLSTSDLLALGDAQLEKDPGCIDDRIAGITPEQPACFIYTSGTTGPPKGVVLPHSTWAFQAKASMELDIAQEGDEGLLYLPLAHSFAQVLKTVWFSLGGPMAFARRIETLVEDMGVIRPTTMASVPRIFEKIYTKVVSAGAEATGVKGMLFAWAMEHFENYVEAREAGRTYDSFGWRLAKRLVFKKIAARLNEIFGGRISFFISGGAPLSPTIMYFFELAGIEILEGYGLTETSAGCTLNRRGEVKIGTVGTPFPGVELKIAPDGEVMIRGPNVMAGYYNQPEATKEAIEPDGWFHSGDIGEIDADGYLKITDRKKDIIVTAGGKNIAPQNLENRLKTHPLISQAVVHGDRRKFLSALITLDEEAIAAWAAQRGIRDKDYVGLTRDPKVKTELQAIVDELNASLPSFETIKKFAVLPADFSQESGELTPTLKVKRRVVERRYRELLDEFYSEQF